MTHHVCIDVVAGQLDHPICHGVLISQCLLQPHLQAQLQFSTVLTGSYQDEDLAVLAGGLIRENLKVTKPKS